MSNVVERLRALLSAATPERPAPLTVEVDGDDLAYIYDKRNATVCLVHDYPHVAQALAAAVNAAPALIAVAEAALAEREALFNDDDRKYVAARKALFAALAALDEVAL